MVKKQRVVSYRPQRKKKRKSLSYKKLSLYSFFCLIICLLIYFVWINYLYIPSVTVFENVWGDNRECAAAIAFKSEPIEIENNGMLLWHAQEGESVANGQVVFAILDDTKANELQKQIIDVENQLANFDKQGLLVKDNDDQHIYHDLRTMIHNYAVYRMNKNESGIKQSFSQINSLVEEFLLAEQNLNQQKKEYEELNAELSSLKALYEQCNIEYITDRDGIVSYRTDNLDDLLIADNFPLENYDWFRKEPEVFTNSENSNVCTGDVVGRIIDDKEWWLIVAVPEKESDIILMAEQLKVLRNDEELNSSYLYHSKDKKNYYFYFKVAGSPSIDSRFIDVVLQTEQIEGYEIPTASIVYENEKAYVFYKEGRLKVKTEVAVIRELVDSVLVEGLTDGMDIVTDVTRIRR